MSSNKGGIAFFKTTVIGGLVFLVPVVVFIAVLTKAAGLMLKVAEPMAGWLPSDSIGGVALANVIVVVGLVLVCFVAGLAARAALLRASVEGLESKVLTKVPGYVLIKGMVSGLKEDEGQSLHPVLATFGAAQRMALEIERLDDGRVVVLVPSSPNPWSGPVHIMDAEDVQRVDIPVTAFVENMQRFGQGTNVLLRSGGELARS